MGDRPSRPRTSARPLGTASTRRPPRRSTWSTSTTTGWRSGSEAMKAVVMRELGGPEVLEVQDVERPDPIATEVLVRVTAAGINPVDWKTRKAGGFHDAVGDPPMILGWDVAGVVEEVDPDVTRFEPGDRVFGM